MSATVNKLLYYFKKNYDDNFFTYKYKIKNDYSYIKKVIAFCDYNSINTIIENISTNEQIILFSSAKRAYETAKKYNGSFICSKYNSEYKKYIDEDELDNIMKNETFDNHLLCATSALDNGVNLVNKNVKHIIIDILDIDEFIQCLGRKRIIEGDDTVNLYFYDWSNKKRIAKYQQNTQKQLDAVYILETLGQNEYVNLSYKNSKFSTKIIDDIVIDNKIHKVINKCMYTKIYCDDVFYKAILKDKLKNSFINSIHIALDIPYKSIHKMEKENKEDNLIKELDRLAGVKLYKEEQKYLIELIGLIDARGRLQKSISMLNQYLYDNKLEYIIISKKSNSKRFWEIQKLITE